MQATVHFANLVSDFVNHILCNNNARATTLVVCSTRTQFLEQLAASIAAESRLHQQDHPEDQQQHVEDEQANLSSEAAERPHPLLTKTIGLLAQSRKVKLVFCPSVEHLRAYLSTLRVTSEDCRGRLAILDLVAVHYTTSEFSAQGLSRTLAIAVEAAARAATDLVLCECNDAVDPQNLERGERLWDLHVPLLSGAVRLGDGRSTWSGRHVSVKRVAQRWFQFDEREPITTHMDI
ncbi:hypothetical protein VTN77DRAFT_2378 [Rasamsonia byssochlamydoides]|uniref:uncharacterized protein n=1 Tax=Rasamsonia byssochlamydoides TaxID=89139 RepID=UPI0037429592